MKNYSMMEGRAYTYPDSKGTKIGLTGIFLMGNNPYKVPCPRPGTPSGTKTTLFTSCLHSNLQQPEYFADHSICKDNFPQNLNTPDRQLFQRGHFKISP